MSALQLPSRNNTFVIEIIHSADFNNSPCAFLYAWYVLCSCETDGVYMMACRLLFSDRLVHGRNVLVSRISLAFPLDRRLTLDAMWDGSQLLVRAVCAGTARMTFDLAAHGSVRMQLIQGHATDSDDVVNNANRALVLSSGDVTNSLRHGILCVIFVQHS